MMFISKNSKAWLAGLCGVLVTFSSFGAVGDYRAIDTRMHQRQLELERFMLGEGRCLGERLDGYLEINHDCPATARMLAEAENQDRLALNRLMATDLHSTPEAVGRKYAQRRQARYQQGVERQIRLADGRITWWNGVPPHPDESDVSRVLTLADARIYAEPDSASRIVKENLRQYEALGVISSKKSPDGTIWYQVTEEHVPKRKPVGWAPRSIGWMVDQDVIPWRQALAMRFTSPVARRPTVIFDQADALLRMVDMDSSARASQLQQIREQIASGLSAGSGAIALEPQVDPNQADLIMYPVLDFYARQTGQQQSIDGYPARLLNIAAQTGYGNKRKQVGIDILFVMDTTNSMQPYLEQVLDATKSFVQEMGDRNVRFGYIGYQDKAPRFDYRAKSFTRQMQSVAQFADTLQQVRARPEPVEGDDIPESVLYGINLALDSGQWRDNAVRLIFLVGDAPDREDEQTIDLIRRKAGQYGSLVHIYAFHIKNSKVSAGWDKQTRKQYTQLSSVYQGAFGSSPQKPHFVGINAGARQFGAQIEDSFRRVAKSFDCVEKSRLTGELCQAESGSLENLIFQQAALLLPDSREPQKNIRGWVADKTLEDATRQALVPIVLFTQTELEDLVERVKYLKEIGLQAQRGEAGTTLDFFDLVSRNTLFTMVNPTAVSFKDAFSAPLGIDQLPYNSVIMSTTRDEFDNPDRVNDFIKKMSRKLDYYEDLLRQRSNHRKWKRLSSGTGEKSWVIGLELDYLP